MVSKLVKKELAKKALSPETDNAAVAELTKAGKDVCRAREKQHRQLREQLAAIFGKYQAGLWITRPSRGFAADVENAAVKDGFCFFS